MFEFEFEGFFLDFANFKGFAFYVPKSFQQINKTYYRISLWDPSRGAPFDPRGPTLLLLTVVLLRVLRFLPTIPLLGGRYAPHDVAMKNKNKI